MTGTRKGTCARCYQPATNPERVETHAVKPRKQNGWVGAQFVPFEVRKGKVNVKTQTICGICAAHEYMDREREGGADVTELESLIADMARKEYAGRASGVDNHSKSPARTNGVASKVARNGHKRNRQPSGASKRKAKPKMTAAEATNFDSISLANATLVESMLGCDCQAYLDVFTFRRWLAQGLAVQKGQKSIKAPPVKVVTSEDDDGETQTRRIKTVSILFCRHQVAPVKAEVAA